MPQHVKAEHPTGLQKRLIDEVTSMMRANDKKLTDLARETGLGKSYLSLLLHGKRPGTMATWDLLIATGKSWGIVVPQRLLVDGYNPKRPMPPLGDLDDTKGHAEHVHVSGNEAGRKGVQLSDGYTSVVHQGSGGGGNAAWVPGLDCSIGEPEPEQIGGGGTPPRFALFTPDGDVHPLPGPEPLLGPEPEQANAPHTRNDVTGQPNRFRPLPKDQ